jgi:hypothetical protein
LALQTFCQYCFSVRGNLGFCSNANLYLFINDFSLSQTQLTQLHMEQVWELRMELAWELRMELAWELRMEQAWGLVTVLAMVLVMALDIMASR